MLPNNVVSVMKSHREADQDLRHEQRGDDGDDLGDDHPLRRDVADQYAVEELHLWGRAQALNLYPTVSHGIDEGVVRSSILARRRRMWTSTVRAPPVEVVAPDFC